MTFMSILSTLFAVFFVYSGFRIETIYNKMSDLKEKTDTYKRLKEKEINDYVSNMKDIWEYTIQLEHTMSFIISKQYEKAIDSLMWLKQEVFVYKVPERISTCHFFLAHCHHEKNTYDDSVIAIQYINEVYEDNQLNPYKREIIDRFEKLDKIESQQLN